MKFQQRIGLGFILIIALLSACAPAESAIVQPTNTPQPTISPTVITMDQNVDAFLNGQVEDISSLSLEERKEFSIILAQKMNEARGARPLVYNNEAYVDPITGMMKNYDGHPDLEETIQMYLPATLDDEGNLLVQNEQGVLEEIKGSQGTDWGTVITDPHDTRINWPTDNLDEEGLSRSQYAVKWGGVLIPVILLDTNLDQLYLSGVNAQIEPTFNFAKIETDSVGNPIYARKIISFGVSTGLNEEGSDEYTKQPWKSWYEVKEELPPFYQKLIGKQVYWMVAPFDQKDMYEGIKNTLDGYDNIVDANDAGSILINQKKDDQNMLIVGIRFLIKKSTDRL